MNRLDTLIKEIESDTKERLADVDISFCPSPDNREVILATVADREELPVFVTQSDTQILCICYLWREEEVRDDKRLAMLEAMLDLNIPLPLSSFARLQDHYVLYGALAAESRAEELLQELITLSDNTIDVIETMSEYLK